MVIIASTPLSFSSRSSSPIACSGRTQRAKIQGLEVIPTGSLAVDVALEAGGLPRGRIVEIFGPESSGKTTLALHTIAEAQKAGLTCVFVDVEHAIDPKYARAIGVNVDTLFLSQPDTGEQALSITDTMVRSGSVDLVVVDSVAALLPRAELEGDMGDQHIGLQARLMSHALRKLTGSVSKSKCLLIFINQIRSKVGVLFGSPEITAGGNALKYYATCRLDIRKTAPIKRGDEHVGNRTRVKIVKNKVGAPFREAEFDMMFGHGINRSGELIDLGVKYQLLHRAGAWFTAPGDLFQTGKSTETIQLGQGRDKARLWFDEHPAEAAILRTKILEKSHEFDPFDDEVVGAAVAEEEAAASGNTATAVGAAGATEATGAAAGAAGGRGAV